MNRGLPVRNITGEGRAVLIKGIKKRFILTVSYGNYSGGMGGTDKVLLAHQKKITEMGCSIFHLCPYPVQKRNGCFLWEIAVDGKAMGAFSTSHVLKLLYELSGKGIYASACYIHHLKGVSLQQLDRILDVLHCNMTMYLHDMQTICPAAGLAKNGCEFCGMGFPSEEKCKDCKTCNKAVQQRVDEIKAFFSRHGQLSFISPSDAAAAIWKKHYPEYENRLRVIYHQKLIGKYTGNMTRIPDEKPLRAAFVGYQMDLKGWPQWYEAAGLVHSRGCNIELFQFGRTDTHCDYIEEVAVDFNKGLDSMVEKLREYNIDCAVLWSRLPETYSYTYYESCASNAFVLTSEISGNIQYQVRNNHNGYIASGDETLGDILTDEKRLRRMINAFRSRGNPGPMELCDNTDILEEIREYKAQPADITKSRVLPGEYLCEWFCRCRYEWQLFKYRMKKKHKADLSGK